MMQLQVKKPGICTLFQGVLDMKFHKIWSRGCGEMASDGRTNGLTHSLATICSPKFFREHKDESHYLNHVQFSLYNMVSIWIKLQFCLVAKG